MASRSVAETTHPVPRAMLQGHPNCTAIQVDNDFAGGDHTYARGDWLLVDLDAVPERGDLVVIFCDGAPFGRICHVPPVKGQDRADMVIGVLDADCDTVCLVHLGKDGRQFGVVVGKIPPKPAIH